MALLASTGLAAGAMQAQRPDCVPAGANDPAPWTWNSRILASFPPDDPRPEFVGAYADSGHELQLWRDSNGVFGELLAPVLEADSPASRLYDVRFDPGTGTLAFTARLPEEEQRFTGTLRADAVAGTLRHGARMGAVTWNKMPPEKAHGAPDDAYVSRAQFECAMNLFRRY